MNLLRALSAFAIGLFVAMLWEWSADAAARSWYPEAFSPRTGDVVAPMLLAALAGWSFLSAAVGGATAAGVWGDRAGAGRAAAAVGAALAVPRLLHALWMAGIHSGPLPLPLATGLLSMPGALLGGWVVRRARQWTQRTPRIPAVTSLAGVALLAFAPPPLPSGPDQVLKASTPVAQAIQRFEAIHGRYPQTLNEAGVNAPLTREGRFEYKSRDSGTSFELCVGDYFRHGFVACWTERGQYIDT